MANRKPNQNQQADKSRPVGNYDPGGQAGENVQSSGQRPANEPVGPFLGKSAGTPPPGSPNSKQTGTPGGKGKQDVRQNQRS